MATTTVTIPNRNYQPGVSAINPTKLLNEGSRCKIVLDVTTWTDPLALLTIRLDYFRAGSWVQNFIFNQVGPDSTGKFYQRDGVTQATQIVAEFSWPPDATDLQGEITISGAAIRTSGTVTVS